MNKELRILREKKIPFLSTFTALLAAVIANTPNKIYTKFILHKNQTNEYYFDNFTLFYIYHGCASSKDSIKTVSKLLLNSFHLVFYWRWRKLLNHIHLRVQNFGNEKKKKIQNFTAFKNDLVQASILWLPSTVNSVLLCVVELKDLMENHKNLYD